jgi:hypothetical protein
MVNEFVAGATNRNAGLHLFSTELLAKPFVAVTAARDEVVKGEGRFLSA